MTDRTLDLTRPGPAGLMFDPSSLNAYGWQRETAAREALLTRCTAPDCRDIASWTDQDGSYCAEHVPEGLKWPRSRARHLQAAE